MALFYEPGGVSTHWEVVASTVPLYLAPTLNQQKPCPLVKKLARRGEKGRGEFWKGMRLIVTNLRSFWAI